MLGVMKSSGGTLSAPGDKLLEKVRLSYIYFKSFQRHAIKLSIRGKTEYVPGVDNFLDNFITHYLSNEKFRKTLIVSLMKGYVAKLEGVANFPMGAKVLNFYMALSASGSSKAFEFVSGNLCGMSGRHSRHIASKKRSLPCIALDQDQMVERLLAHIAKVRMGFKYPSKRVVITCRLDGTVMSKSWQISHSCKVAVGVLLQINS